MDFWKLFAGLGIFLFGIFLMEESLRELSGRAFKKFVRRFTSSSIKGVLSGTVSTALLQSSSVVSLMLLAFVGAGIMSMQNAISVLVGSNLGTTLTSWIVATVGFKLNIEALSLPLVGLGGLGLIFLGKSGKASNVSKLIVGFGFLFMGLDYMKGSIDQYAQGLEISQFPDLGLLTYFLAGLVITAAVQSSSASMAIILSVLFSGLITFEMATLMVIGTNLGTTVTVLIGSLGGSSAKKQVALSHLIFNGVTAIVAFSLLGVLTFLIQDVFLLKDDPIIGLALFHSLFNLLGIFIFLPLIPLLAKLVSRVLPDKRETLSTYVSATSAEVPEAGLEAVRKEVLLLLRWVMAHNIETLRIERGLVMTEDGWEKKKSSMRFLRLGLDQKYHQIKALQTEIFAFASALQKSELEGHESRALNRFLHSVRYAVAAAKTLKDIRHNIGDMESSENQFAIDQYKSFRKKKLQQLIAVDKMLQKQSEEVTLPEMVKEMQGLKTEDDRWIQEITVAMQKGDYEAGEISGLMSVHRNLTLSIRQLLLSVKDFQFREVEDHIFESWNFEDAGHSAELPSLDK